jgi:hypothetical protein
MYVVAELVQYFHWTYVSVVYHGSSYGVQGREELLNALSELKGRKICIDEDIEVDTLDNSTEQSRTGVSSTH